MRVPAWLTLGVALSVTGFGLYRIGLALRARAAAEPTGEKKRGFAAMTRRTHALIGIVYLLLGGALIATTYGWNPFGTLFGSPAPAPARDAAPRTRSVPIDQLPKPANK